MKSIKVFLFIVSLLLIVAVGFGVYVWFVFQQTQNQLNEQGYPSETIETIETTGMDTETKEDEIVTTIDVNTLPDAQKKAIKTLGFEGESIIITDGMAACAEDAVGKKRLDEIIGGATPSPLESLQLLPCFKK